MNGPLSDPRGALQSQPTPSEAPSVVPAPAPSGASTAQPNQSAGQEPVQQPAGAATTADDRQIAAYRQIQSERDTLQQQLQQVQAQQRLETLTSAYYQAAAEQYPTLPDEQLFALSQQWAQEDFDQEFLETQTLTKAQMYDQQVEREALASKMTTLIGTMQSNLGLDSDTIRQITENAGLDPRAGDYEARLWPLAIAYATQNNGVAQAQQARQSVAQIPFAMAGTSAQGLETYSDLSPTPDAPYGSDAWFKKLDEMESALKQQGRWQRPK